MDLERAGHRVTWTGAGVNAFLVVLKLAGGLLGNSQALVADAVHSVSDFVTDAVVLIGLSLGRRAPDESHHFGHGRIETLASALVGLSLIGVAIGLGWRAGQDILAGGGSRPTWLAVVVAAVSVVAKEVLFQLTIRVGRRIHSPVVVANAWHHRSDALSSVAVLVGVGATLIRPDWHVLDAFAALLVAVLVLKVGVDVLRAAVSEMVDTAPSAEVLEAMGEAVDEVPGVLASHDLKARTVGGEHQVQVHVEVDGAITVLEGHRIADEVAHRLRERVGGVGEVLVHVDPEEPPAACG